MKIQKMHMLTITIVMIAVIFLLAGPLLTGCGEEQITDSNTNSVENVRRDGAAEEELNNSEIGSEYAPMKEIKASVEEILGDNYWPDKQLTAEELETETGIKAEMHEEYLAEQQSIKTDIDTMIIIKAKKEFIGEVETMLNEYRDSLMVKYKDRPQELGKVEASRIETIDSYICFVQLGADTKAASQTGDDAVLNLCQQENERAVDVIEKTILDQ